MVERLKRHAREAERSPSPKTTTEPDPGHR